MGMVDEIPVDLQKKMSAMEDTDSIRIVKEEKQSVREMKKDINEMKKIVRNTLKELFESGNRIAPLSRIRTMYAGDGKRFQIKTSLAQQSSTEVSSPCFLVSLEDISETCKIRGEVLKERYHLTEREIEVVQSVSEGLTNEDVARRLFISRFTVENHLKSIFEKTGVKNRTELASRIEFP